MTEFDIQFELDWEKYSIFRKGKRMNRMIDTAVMPDFTRKIYLVKKDRKGYNDWYELKPNACDELDVMNTCNIVAGDWEIEDVAED